jgi:hypothetical protein
MGLMQGCQGSTLAMQGCQGSLLAAHTLVKRWSNAGQTLAKVQPWLFAFLFHCVSPMTPIPNLGKVQKERLVAFPTAFAIGLITVGGPLGEREAAGLGGEGDEAEGEE